MAEAPAEEEEGGGGADQGHMTVEEINEEVLECARYGEVDELREMLAREGADVHTEDENGNTALHKAAANGFVECIQVLLEHGARHPRNRSGNTPFHWAVQNKQVEAARLLMNHFAEGEDSVDVVRTNEFGRSAITDAFQTGMADMITLCLEHPSATEERLAPEQKEEAAQADAAAEGATEGGDTAAAAAASGAAEDASPLERLSERCILHSLALGSAVAGEKSAEESSRSGSRIRIRELVIPNADSPFGDRPEEDFTGFAIWPASLVAARWTAACPSMLEGASVLELGAGCAVPALAAALYCNPRSVVATDLNPATLENMRHNLSLLAEEQPDKAARVEVRSLDWGRDATWPARGSLDVVVGADLVYDAGILPLLLGVVTGLLRDGGTFLYVAPNTERAGMVDLVPAATEHGLELVELRDAPEEFYANPLPPLPADDNETKANADGVDGGEGEDTSGAASSAEQSADVHHSHEGEFMLHFSDMAARAVTFQLYHFRKTATATTTEEEQVQEESAAATPPEPPPPEVEEA